MVARRARSGCRNSLIPSASSFPPVYTDADPVQGGPPPRTRTAQLPARLLALDTKHDGPRVAVAVRFSSTKVPSQGSDEKVCFQYRCIAAPAAGRGVVLPSTDDGQFAHDDGRPPPPWCPGAPKAVARATSWVSSARHTPPNHHFPLMKALTPVLSYWYTSRPHRVAAPGGAPRTGSRIGTRRSDHSWYSRTLLSISFVSATGQERIRQMPRAAARSSSPVAADPASVRFAPIPPRGGHLMNTRSMRPVAESSCPCSRPRAAVRRSTSRNGNVEREVAA